MKKTYGDNPNVSIELEKVLSRKTISNINFVYEPAKNWYRTAEAVEQLLLETNHGFMRKSVMGWIHNPCMYITGDYAGCRGQKWVIIITDRIANRSFIYYIDK